MLKEDNRRPEILYKYYPVEPWLPKLFTGASIKFSSRTTFNDPLDSHPAYRIDSGQDGRKSVKDALIREGMKGPKLIRELNRVLRRTAEAKSFGPLLGNSTLDQVGILCLTESWENALLWAHYSRSHTGICIGFDTRMDVFRLARPISYSKKAPVITRPYDESDEMVRKAFFCKDECWGYEKEWRTVKYLQTEDQRKDYERRAHL